MRLVDAHIHIDFYDNIEEILRDTIACNIQAVFVTHLPELFERYNSQMKLYDNICLALGFHPILIREYELNKALFLKMKDVSKFIGEVGLDYSITSSQSLRAKQREAFDFICNNIDNHVLSIHSRLADEDALRILIDAGVKKAIFHWYTGSEKLLNDILAQGYYFSINPTMLRSNKGIGILKQIPVDRILIETDGPFTKYGGQVVTPSDMLDIYRNFSEFYEIKELQNTVWENFSTLIK